MLTLVDIFSTLIISIEILLCVVRFKGAINRMTVQGNENGRLHGSIIYYINPVKQLNSCEKKIEER